MTKKNILMHKFVLSKAPVYDFKEDQRLLKTL